MFRDLFVNGTILISFIFISSQIFKGHFLGLSVSYNDKFFFGLTQGILGIILMLFTIDITTGVILDFRHISIILAALYGGAFASIIAGITISIFRIVYFGVSTSAIIAASNMFLVAVVCAILSKLNLNNLKKFNYMNFISSIIISVTFLLVIKDSTTLIFTLLNFGVASFSIGILAYYISNYMHTSIKLLNRLKQESTIDFLTGLNNVRQFDNTLNQSFLNVIDKNERLSILIIDIDFFKKVNDTYGHLSGDAVLHQLGTLLSISSRSFDTVSRIGGEEFSVILPDCPSHQAIEVAERLRVSVETYQFIISDEVKINITISIGAATYPDNVADLDNLINEADNALYSAKRTGRNKVCQP
ncbi:diguanylate cyclase [Clostridium sp.]|uniref:GGDEF domain-containing protein n=1 Tax=Clostridium sp. TaxID=1506 RepID=UPI001A525D80|nr:diguanylate cyclase [Clostridium sp.]MBK5240472.1 diguanylate cyclase [Clostridium sp.]